MTISGMRFTCVLFDFDGPVCHLFKEYAAAEVARSLLARLAEPVRQRVLANGNGAARDPQQILGLLDGSLVGEFEAMLTREELTAADSARATPGAASLIRDLGAARVLLAITTNNAKAAAERYLARDDVGLLGLFGAEGEHVHGRAPDPRLRKPDPYCLWCALKSTGARREETLMIGDAVADFEAAAALDIAFLGYAESDRKERLLTEAGAYVTRTMPRTCAELAEVVRQL